jgi:hypothetical protein
MRFSSSSASSLSSSATDAVAEDEDDDDDDDGGGGDTTSATAVLSASDPRLELSWKYLSGGTKLRLVVTTDGSRAAHWEHTVAVTENGPRILTV